MIGHLKGWSATEGARDANLYPALGRVHSDHARRFDALADDGPVLDVGTGRNPIGEHLGGREVVGIDVDESLISEAATKDPSGEYQVADVTRMTFDSGQFSACFMRGVVHHLALDEIPSAFEEIRRVLAPDGILYILEPDPMRVPRRVVWRLADALGYDGEQTEEAHLPPDVVALQVRRAGFDVVERGHRGSMLTPLAFLSTNRSLAGPISRVDAALPTFWWAELVARNRGSGARR